MRNQGKSISELSAKYINPRVRVVFFLIVFLELLIVIAIFGMIIAILFDMYPQAVFPIWMEVPIAIALGFIVYKRRGNVVFYTAFAVLIMYITVVAGHFFPLRMPALFGMPATGVWTIILLVYAYIASTLPVTTLLQPRDYINAWELFIAMFLLTIGAIASVHTGQFHIVAPAVNLHPPGAPPLWPFLFVTIACGAISGFHSLVSSGTSSKQVSNERDALFVGYGSMLMEGALAVLMIVAVAAGIGIAYTTKDGSILSGTAAWTSHYSSWSAAGGLNAKIEAVVVGSANIMSNLGIPYALGLVIIGVFVVSFAATTLDTATRIQRYVISELTSGFKIPLLSNRWIVTAFAVITAGMLAFLTGASGKGALTLWPLFGATNQLLAALALIIITLYLKTKGGFAYILAGIPCLFMLIMTSWTMIINEKNFINKGNGLLISVNTVVFLLAIWTVVEGITAFFKPKKIFPAYRDK